jgi:hypothetical protein
VCCLLYQLQLQLLWPIQQLLWPIQQLLWPIQQLLWPIQQLLSLLLVFLKIDWPRLPERIVHLDLMDYR